MRTSIVGNTVALALMAAKTEGADVSTGAGQSAATDGTMISDSLRGMALTAINAAWEIQDKVVNVSQMVLGLAKVAAKEAKGDLKLALAKFKAAIAGAEAAITEEHGTGKQGKAKVEAFLANGSIWKQYVSNIGAGLNEAFDPTPFKTESAYRTARQNAKKASRTVADLRTKIGDVLNIGELSDTELLDYAKENENQIDSIVEALKEDGYEEAIVDPEKREKQLHTQSEADAAKYFRGIEASTTKPRECLATILRTCAKVNWEGEHGEDATREMSNFLTKLLKFAATKGEAPIHKGSRAIPPGKEQQAGVSNL